jgi:hypothetical protein
MAKKKVKKTSEAASPAANPAEAVVVTAAARPVITSNGYQLAVINNPTGISLRLELTSQPDAVQYHLRINSTNDRTELVQEVLNKLADLWPAFDWHFTADASGEITDIV